LAATLEFRRVLNRRMERMNPAVLQCMSCRSVLSDTLAYYIVSDEEASTVTVRDARVVSVGTEEAVSATGWDRGYSYRRLWCAVCRASLGRMYSSTAMRHDAIREAYTFDTRALVSYELGSLAAAESHGDHSRGAFGRHANVAAGWRPDGTQAPDRGRLLSLRTMQDGVGDRRPDDQFGANDVEGRNLADLPGKSAHIRLRDLPVMDETSAIKVAVSELDDHVCKLTTATNQVTVAQRKFDTELGHISHSFQGLRDEHRTMEDQYRALQDAMRSSTQQVGLLGDNLRDVDGELVKMENLFLIWEERFKRIETALHLPPMVSVLNESSNPATVSHLKSPDAGGTPVDSASPIRPTGAVNSVNIRNSGEDYETPEVGNRYNSQTRGRRGSRGRKRNRNT
jgi:Yippee zinc-binding/DNA-binding /Mis18, centromere assembly